MFHMEFHSLDAVDEDEDRASLYRNGATATVLEQYRQRSSASPPKIYEGRVGKFGGTSRMQRVVNSNETVVHTVSHIPSLTVIRTRSLNSDSSSSRSLSSETASSRTLNLESARSLDSETSIPRNWVEVDLIDFSDSPKAQQPQPQPQATTTSIGEQEVIRELVKPFADSVTVTNNGGVVPEHQPPIRDLLSNGVPEEAVVDAVVSKDAKDSNSNSSGSLRVRTDSMPSTNSAYSSQSRRSEDSDSESTPTAEEKVGGVKDEEKGSPASKSLNKAFSKFKHHKKSKPGIGESKVVKPWDEPLLHAHEQVKMERKAQKEAKLEAKRVAEAAKKEAEIQQKELLKLANPIPESSLKHQGVLKGAVHKLFSIHGGSHSRSPSPREGVHGDVREAKLVMPRASMFEASPGMSPSTTDAALAQIRSGPRPVAKTDLQFATVESNQRDVQPWTMEEYMAKNARIAEWEKREDDEEFGGIENNQLLQNQYFDDDVVMNDFDDSDSD